MVCVHRGKKRRRRRRGVTLATPLSLHLPMSSLPVITKVRKITRRRKELHKVRKKATGIASKRLGKEGDQRGGKKTGAMDRHWKQALRHARMMFECVGVLLGFSILNSCPIGVGLPSFVWSLLLQQEVDETGNAVRRKHRDLIHELDLCGQDSATLRSLAVILHDMTNDELDGMAMTFSGSKYRWDPHKQTLRLEEVDLVPGGSEMSVTGKNKSRYVKLYTRARYLPAGMEESIAAMRMGLLRVIPQKLLNILSASHIEGYMQGDANFDMSSLRANVSYENGFSPTHRVIKLFWHLLENDLSEAEKRSLLLFWTGTSTPPRGGFGDGGDYDEVVLRFSFPFFLLFHVIIPLFVDDHSTYALQ